MYQEWIKLASEEDGAQGKEYLPFIRLQQANQKSRISYRILRISCFIQKNNFSISHTSCAVLIVPHLQSIDCCYRLCVCVSSVHIRLRHKCVSHFPSFSLYTICCVSASLSFSQCVPKWCNFHTHSIIIYCIMFIKKREKKNKMDCYVVLLTLFLCNPIEKKKTTHTHTA